LVLLHCTHAIYITNRHHVSPTSILHCKFIVLTHGRYDESTARKRALEEELADLEGKLERAEKLVTGLAGERTRWWVKLCMGSAVAESP
jgi:hypothetical protein